MYYMFEFLFAIFLGIFAVISAAIGVGLLAGKGARNQTSDSRENRPNKKHAPNHAQFNISFQEVAEIRRAVGASGRRSSDIEDEYRAMIN